MLIIELIDQCIERFDGFIICCLFACCLLFAIDCLLFIDRYIVRVASCLLLIADYWLFIVCCLLPADYFLLSVLLSGISLQENIIGI